MAAKAKAKKGIDEREKIIEEVSNPALGSVYFDDDWYAKPDGAGWALVERFIGTKKDGTKVRRETVHGYFANLHVCAMRYVDERIRGGLKPNTPPKEIILQWADATEKICKAIVDNALDRPRDWVDTDVAQARRDKLKARVEEDTKRFRAHVEKGSMTKPKRSRRKAKA